MSEENKETALVDVLIDTYDIDEEMTKLKKQTNTFDLLAKAFENKNAFYKAESVAQQSVKMNSIRNILYRYAGENRLKIRSLLDKKIQSDLGFTSKGGAEFVTKIIFKKAIYKFTNSESTDKKQRMKSREIWKNNRSLVAKIIATFQTV